MSKTKKEMSPLPSIEDIEKNFMSDVLDEPQGPENLGPDEEEEEEGDDKIEVEKGPHRTRSIKHLQEMGDKTSVRIKREDGVYKKRMPIECQGLSSSMLPPITKRKVAVYEVLGKDQIDPLTKEAVIAPPLIIPGRYVIYDPYQSDVLARHRLLKNVTRSEKVVRDGKEMVEEVVEDLIFIDGFKNVPIDRNYLEYVLLELHPLNESNKRRDRSQAPAFRRIDVGNRRNWADTIAGMDLAFEAETAVVNMRTREKIVQYATAIGIPTAGRMLESGDNSVKIDLRRFARQNPREFFMLNKNESMAIKMAVMEADDIGTIEYEVDKRQWVFSTDGDLVCQHLPGEDPMEALVKMLQKADYREKYERIQEELNYWE